MNIITDFTLFEKNFSSKEREKLADKGFALPDGSFPIKDKKDLMNAIKAQGRGLRNADEKRKKKVHSHIRKRAKALGVDVTTNDNDNVVTKK